MTQVMKDPKNNIYVNIPSNFLSTVSPEVVNRLAKFYDQTFYRNDHALRAIMASECLAIRGKNVDRCVWTIGPGGVGQSLLTRALHTMLAGSHSYLDVQIFYSDDELRKQASEFSSAIALTAQESASNNTHKLREDLYKKIITG